MSKSLAGLSLRDLEYVEAVAELKHFGRAAERCGVSQPALSEQVRKLEAHLGVPIFERTKRRVAVTAQGEILLMHIDRLLAEARHLLALGRQSTDLSGFCNWAPSKRWGLIICLRFWPCCATHCPTCRCA